MNVDFTNDIIKLKRQEVVYRPFRQSCENSVYVYEERENEIVKVAFQNVESIANYFNHLGLEWDQKEYDSEQRLIRILPDLEKAEVVAADPQWNVDNLKPRTAEESIHESARKVEDIPHLAVELREVDHPIGFDERSESSEQKDYSELWAQVNSQESTAMMFMKGDMVKNINPECKHFQSEGEVVDVKELHSAIDIKDYAMMSEDEAMMRKMYALMKEDEAMMRRLMGMMQEDEAMMRRLRAMMEEDEAMMKKNRIGYAISYKTTNEGMNWMKGEVLEKTPDQLEKIESMMRRPMM
tara:strand:+ start:198 stop:1085 length:888 start_codon:yes stop_codon:yes gene_type:complete